MTINALPAPSASDVDATVDPSADAPADEAVPTRLCGRCRRAFPIDGTIDRPALSEWWACPSCAASLLPSRQRASTTSTESPTD
ncbi:MAG: hypothetical protein WCA90_19335 [Ilumatobacteraceae bacterium]|jgi:hypothetical protein